MAGQVDGCFDNLLSSLLANVANFQFPKVYNVSAIIRKLAGSRQSYCTNKQAHFFGPPCKCWNSWWEKEIFLLFTEKCHTHTYYNIAHNTATDQARAKGH